MSHKNSIYHIHLNIANICSHHYQEEHFTLAIQTNESLEHFILRIIALALIPHRPIQFARGVHTKAEADLMIKDHSDHIIYWIDAGLVSMPRLRKASGKADHIIVIDKQGLQLLDFVQQLPLFQHLRLISLEQQFLQQVEAILQKSITWNIIIEDNQLTISDQQHYLQSTLQEWMTHDEQESLFMVS